MFKNLRETIKALNADVNNVANCEKAKKLRKKLLTVGLILAIGGFVGGFICFALFATTGFGSVSQHGTDFDNFSPGFPSGVIVPFILMVPCFVVGSIGASLASLGFKIVVTGYTTNLVNEVVGNNCPNCGATFSSDSCFCAKCGKKVRKECPQCKHINNYQNEYCEKCGHKLG